MNATKIDDGGLFHPLQDAQAIHAFAVAEVEGITETDERDRIYMAARSRAIQGASLRDYIATHASDADVDAMLERMDRENLQLRWDADRRAAARYRFADLMIAARKS